MVLASLLFGIGLGIYFGIAEDSIKMFIKEGIAAHPTLHDTKSADKLWRYVQRAHFHASGISGFSIGLIILVVLSSLRRNVKTITAILIGLGGLYPLSWFSMFLLGPSIGRSAAHDHFITEFLVYVGTGGLLIGIGILCANILLGSLSQKRG